MYNKYIVVTVTELNFELKKRLLFIFPHHQHFSIHPLKRQGWPHNDCISAKVTAKWKK